MAQRSFTTQNDWINYYQDLYLRFKTDTRIAQHLGISVRELRNTMALLKIEVLAGNVQAVK